jgi:hypothetical protein
MADTKISALTAATTPLAGTEVLPIVQSSATVKVSVANLTAGRSVSATSFVPTGSTIPANGVYLPASNAVGIATNTTNAVYIDATQNVLVGCTALPAGARTKGFGAKSNATGGFQVYQASSNTDWAINVTSGSIANLYSDNGTALVLAGQILVNGNLSAYTSVSDYRLKENVQPMVGALAKVQSLKPVTYTFKNSGQESQGFIAHELQEFVPECVMGAKDAVDEDGKPQYQSIDTSFLIATLTAAIQELNTKFEEYKTLHS